MEIEAKLILPSCKVFEEVKKRLTEINAVFEAKIVEEDVYYQHPCRDFAKTDEALRVRITKESVELTYKGPKKLKDLKARDEFTIRLLKTQYDELKKILESLGFKPAAIVRKEREYYRLNEVKIALDNVEELGCFVEIEYVGDGDVDKARKVIHQVASLIGVANYPSTTKSYLELLLEKRKK